MFGNEKGGTGVPKSVTMIALCLVGAWLVSVFYGMENHGADGSVSTKPATAPTFGHDPEGGDITTERFNGVKAALEEAKGGRCERDPNAPDTVRIYLPAGVYPAKTDALAIATTARSRLGDNAIVYVNAIDGSTIAKATPWGTE